MRKVIILGNCLAERLAILLKPVLERRNLLKLPNEQWELVQVPPVYNLPLGNYTHEKVADLVDQCDLVFTQPLFNFGVLNTQELKKKSGLQIHTFSAPNFDAYFPDLVHAGALAKQQKSLPPLQWHSRIFLEFKALKVNPLDFEKFYLSHPLFQTKNMVKVLEQSWELYKRRELDVEIGTLETVSKNFATEILFYTWKHPADRIIKTILSGMLKILNFSKTETEQTLARLPFQEKPDQPDIWSSWGFGFNAWPVISRGNMLYKFQGREFFRISGQKLDILTAALLWFQYYDQNPEIYTELLKIAFPEKIEKSQI